MADKNVRLKDASGNFLYPESKAAVVYNNSNQNLGTVEAGAQVNILEKVKVNGVELNVVDKAVDITVPSAYSPGTGISISNNTVAVDTDVIATRSFVNTELSDKADKATTLSGYGITDGVTFVEITS